VRVLPQPAFQLGHPCPQRLDDGGLLGVGGPQRGVGRSQLSDQGGVDGDDRLQVACAVAVA